MPNICTGDHYSCGETASWKTGVHSAGNQTQVRNRQTSFALGATTIIVNKEVRNFDIHFSGGWSASPTFLMRNEEGGLFACGVPDYSGNTPHAVNESYNCTNTVLYFLDMRYNNAICKKVTEIVTFSEASSAVAGFKETWGVFYYPKFVIKNHVVTTTTEYFVVLNGIKTVLKTTTSTTLVNGPTNPLILVWPNPPGLAIPWINCDDDIKIFGFYDYHNADDGSAMIQRDGGDDFYFTDWMRNISVPSLVQDQADADNRYFDFYLGDGTPGTASYPNPGIATDSTPVGSIAQDSAGNIFYSFEIDGYKFNSLSAPGTPITDPRKEYNLETMFPTLGANKKFFPVGVI